VPVGAAAPIAAPDSVGLVADALRLLDESCPGQIGRNGEAVLGHAKGTLAILREVQADEPTCIAAALFGAGSAISLDAVRQRFGAEVATLVDGMRQALKLRELHRPSVRAATGRGGDGEQLETLRRMLLAMALDIRVVILRLSSRLQTLRWHALNKSAPSAAICEESLEVLAPLANRLGLWQLKWELEDLAFRFMAGDTYRSLARQLEEKRREREDFVAAITFTLRELLTSAGLRAEVTGRPKHIYSIWNKMRSKRLALDDIRDLRGLRVIVDDVRECYSALALIHSRWAPIHEEFDDYIARPKPNGYQSLHTVVLAEDGRPLEVQIRTRAMHQFAEYGVASHWRYKERSTGVAGSQRADAAQDQRIAWVRQLLAWQREVGEQLGAPVLGGGAPGLPRGAAGGAEGSLGVVPLVDEEHVRIYALTPQARVIELPAGATPVDFAYHVHSTLGHRCRGARVDGQLVPLNTPLANGQTVEIITARPGSGAEGPSRDWLNAQLGYVRSNRARTKVRQWFNALELARDVASGREKVERTMAREGRTALSFDELSARLSQPDVQAMFVAVAREEIGPRQLEEAVRGPAALDAGAAAAAGDAALPAVLAAAAERARARSKPDNDGVLVVGVDLLLTQLARCCRPVPPDPIRGFVTKGRGVSVHRANCPTFAQMARMAPERVLDTDWGQSNKPGSHRERAYAVDVVVRANDRAGLLRDVSEVFARDRLNVTAVHTQSRSHIAHMQFTVEVQDAGVLNRTLAAIREVGGVFEAMRR